VDILIEESESSLWAAAVQNARIEGLDVDPAGEEVRWGSIYWGKVKTIDKALDAVFVDLDGENTGILYNRDVRVIDNDGAVEKGGKKAIGKMLSPGDMVIVQAKSSYLPKANDKDRPREDKIPQLSMDVTLPGRYLIYAPFTSEHQVSMRIRDKKMRKTLLTMMAEISEVDEQIGGCILRSAAADLQTDILVRESKILHDIWSQLQQFFRGPDVALIMLGPGAIQRILSDHATQPIERIEVVIMDHFHQVEEWCGIFAPDLVPKIEPVELENAQIDFALFDHRDVVGQIEDLFHPYAMLQSGGNIIIQETAALTAVDVNAGGNKRGHLGVNIEAAKEIARQMRLRNMGGIIIVDFLKLKSKTEKDTFLSALEDAILEDPCTVQIHGLTKLGLIEMTRKRRTPPLQERFEDK
jgi:ribonuclease G